MSALNLEADELFYSFRVMRDTDHLTTPLLTYMLCTLLHTYVNIRYIQYFFSLLIKDEIFLVKIVFVIIYVPTCLSFCIRSCKLMKLFFLLLQVNLTIIPNFLTPLKVSQFLRRQVSPFFSLYFFQTYLLTPKRFFHLCRFSARS